MLSWLALLVVIHHLRLIQSSQNCSALHAFVEVRGSTNKTLTSAQALFPPHVYPSIAWTQLIALQTDDDICDVLKPPSTDISNKIVLLFEASGDCSAHYKVLAAQQHGASAVLLANNDPNGNIQSVPNDSELKDNITTILMRSISLQDGELLYDELTAESNMEVKIGCFDSNYSAALCVKEATGAFTTYTGNYQRQDELVNSHPIWKSPGSPNLRGDIHIFLHDGDGSEPWFWAITTDSKFKYDSSIKLKCGTLNITTVTDPTLCPLWFGTKNWGNSWFPLREMNVSAHLCGDIGERLCVDSYEHKLAGLRGTYISTVPGEPYWMRELTQCDHRNGFVSFVEDGYYGTGYFVLHEALNKWQIAVCSIARNESENGTFASAKWRPDLCNEWLSRNDYDLRYSAKHRTYDATFNISRGACSAERAAIHQRACVESDPPETMCFANNSIMHGSAMGEYEKLNETGPVFGTPIYQRIEYDDPLGKNATSLYIWYTNEAWAQLNGGDLVHNVHYRKWVISDETIEGAIDRGSFSEYAHCFGYSYGNPFQCQGWVFYAASAYHYDEQMTVTDTECETDPFPSIPRFWLEFICIGFKNASSLWAHKWSKLHVDQLTSGTFVRNTSFLDDTMKIPYWDKAHNDLEHSRMYLVFNDIWMVMNESMVLMYCNPYDSSAASIDPLKCVKWYDFNWELLDNVYFYKCTEDDILTASPTSSPTPAPSLSPSAAPTKANVEICLSRNGRISSLLEGIFINNASINNDDEDEFGGIQFVSRNKHLDAPLYLWYHNTFWWLSPMDHKTRHSANASEIDVYGYCRGGTQENVPVCYECWVFFWRMTSLDTINMETIEDCSFQINSDLDDCDASNSYSYSGDDFAVSDGLCMNRLNGKKNRDENHPYAKLDDIPEPANILKNNLGVYTLINNDDFISSVSYAHGKKSNIIYIWHDKIPNNWLISYGSDENNENELRNNLRLLMCDGSKTGFLIGNCWLFDWAQMKSVAVDNVLSIAAICHATKTNESNGKTVASVIAIIVAVICFGGIVLMWRHCAKDDEHKAIDRETETELTATGTTGTASKALTGSKAKTHSLKAYDDVDDDGIPAYDMGVLNEDQEMNDGGNDPLTA